MGSLSLLLAFVLSAAQVHAGLYKCDDAESEPKLTASKVTKVNVDYVAPFLRQNAKDEELHRGKKPFLVYYAVDSEEPFMRIAVDLEVSKLEESCLASPAVNFAAILNSLYVTRNEFIICKHQKLSRVSLSDFPELNRSLIEKRRWIGRGDHTLDDLGPTFIPSFYEEVSNSAFARFPLSHPDFVYDLLNLLTTEKALFPTEEFMPFLNLKSHGSKEYVLSGLHQCQLTAKKKAQEDYIGTLAEKDSSSLADALKLGPAAGAGGDLGGEHLGQDNLGGEHLGGEHLGGEHLGGEHLGPVQGLGADEGLGGEFAFGTIHVSLNFILARLFNGKDRKVMGFVMLESCDTERDYIFNNTKLHHTLGFYSAKTSLWYRNLNWWSLLHRANGSSKKLLEELDTVTRLIPNYEIIRK